METLKGDFFQLSALIIPLPQLINKLQEIRKNHTKDGAANLIPHITVLYPFFNSIDEYLKNSEKLEKICSQVASFSINISTVSEFSNNFVLYLKAVENELLKSLIQKIANFFPQYPPYQGLFKIEDISPHCTVAISKNINDFNIIKKKYTQYLNSLLPEIFQINDLWLIVKSNDLWYLYKKFKLK